MVSPQNTYLSKRKRVFMTKSYHIRCPKCNNNHSFYRYGKDSDGYQKYLCRNCHHQFAPDRPRSEGQIVGGNIRLVPCAERPFCITITNTIPTTAAAIRSAIISFLSGNRPLRSFPTVIQPTIFWLSLFFTAPGTYVFKALRTMFPTI